MARKPPAHLRAVDLTDANGAAAIIGCTRSRIHQYAAEGKLKAYVFIDGDLVEAEGQERQGRIALFDRYEVGKLRDQGHSKGGRPRKNEFHNLSGNSSQNT